MADEQNSQAEINTPAGSVKFSGKRMAEFIAVLALCALVLYGYVLFEHKADAKAFGDGLTAAMKDMAQSVREGNCINSFPEAERENKLEYCKRITR